MTLVCNYCGKPIKSREAHYAGMRDGLEYTIHPACRENYMKAPEKLGK